MDKFVARENIRHFRDRLETEADPTNRSVLHKLLLHEEDKLGHNSEALTEIENYVAAAKEYKARQHACIASAERNGHDTTKVRALLAAYSEILLAFESQREKVLIRLKESQL